MDMTVTKRFRPAAADAKQRAITAMFERIAPKYDRLNSLLSWGMHIRWRRKLVAWIPDEPLLELDHSRCLLDVATGSGDVLLQGAAQLKTYAQFIGLDLAPAMLEIARAKLDRSRSAMVSSQPVPIPAIEFRHGDGRNLGIPSASVHALTIAFGLRNIQGTAAALAEFRRVLVPEGTLLVLEFMGPGSWALRLLWRLGGRLLPLVAGLCGQRRSDYAYLPQSVLSFATVSDLASMAAAHDLILERTHRFCFGICHLMSFQKRDEGG